MRGFAGTPMASDPTRNVPPPAASLDKRHIRVLLLEGVHGSAEDALRRAGYTAITSIPQALPEADLIEALRGVHMLASAHEPRSRRGSSNRLTN